jgi:hypothetical protein
MFFSTLPITPFPGLEIAILDNSESLNRNIFKPFLDFSLKIWFFNEYE